MFRSGWAIDPKIDDAALEKIFDAFAQSRVSMHVNLIAGFPGDSPEKLRKTVDFVGVQRGPAICGFLYVVLN